MTVSDAPVTGLDVGAYRVPTDAPEADGTLAWDSTTIVVVRAHAEDRTGTGYTYAPAATAGLVEEVLAPVVRGSSALDVPATWQRMVAAVRNAGTGGVGGMAVSAVDTALWDLRARLLDVPLARLLGQVRDEVPVYGSGGFTTYDDDRTAAQLGAWVEDGIPRVKIKIGQDWGRDLARDRHRIALARRTIGGDAELFVDANGGYSAHQAVRLLDEVADCEVAWFEEPVSSEDLAGLRFVREHVSADVAAGEYGHDAAYFRRMCAAGAVDCLQVDVTRGGGFTGWQQAVAVARSFGLPLSAHCAPQLSVAACAATPALRHAEWFHDHVRIERLLLDGFRSPVAGAVPVGDGVGNGLLFKDADAARYRVDWTGTGRP